MALSDNEIRKLVKDKKLIKPFDETRLQSASYDVVTGNIIRVFQRLNNPISLRNPVNLDSETLEVDISNGYHIKPAEYILVKTGEYFTMPDDLAARIRPRTTFSRIGLLLFDQHLNPSFKGHLYLGLYNATPNVIDIYPQIAVGQIVFERVDGSISPNKLYRNKPDAKYQDETSFKSPRLDSAKSQSTKIERLMLKVLEGN